MVSITENQLMSIHELGRTLTSVPALKLPRSPLPSAAAQAAGDRPSGLGRLGEYSVEFL